ncbi:hypothetical protein GCM10018785_68490 [Streptomyces longispororuber]|uniref:Uncharacterized protein n=1 Tax=Streptomyces longispororuber TaxID=68230 RepID=A0A919DZ30_9ACTN|nr:hypothetical protein [Streptomyces longispororuber]GHE92638.1 hypothetical protein GCM10018785_68490 [Streptomyces longispororuber]
MDHRTEDVPEDARDVPDAVRNDATDDARNDVTDDAMDIPDDVMHVRDDVTDVPDDVLATVDLLEENAPAPKGDEPAPAAARACGAQVGHPLLYALPAGPGGTGRRHRELLLCFPFDLEELPDGRRYREAELTVDLDDGLRALTLHPASVTIARPAPHVPYDADVTAFGLGGSRLRWVFRAPDGDGLRPDGRWTQTLVRLPPGATEVAGRIGLSALVERPRLFGVWPRTPARLPQAVPFRLPLEEAWTTTGPLTGHTALPGSWALPSYEPYESHAPHEPHEPHEPYEPYEGDDDGGADDANAHEPLRTHRPDEDLPPGLRRLCLAVDVEKYSARDNADMVRLQRVLLRTLRAACARARVGWHTCGRQAQGDGYLLVLAPGVDETRVVPALLAGLADGLASANGARPARAPRGPQPAPEDPPRPLRMRASLHQGIVHEADSGWAGSAVVALFRVLDCGPLRQALESDAEAVLAVAFSDSLYQDLVPHGYAGLSPEGFHRVDVRNPAKDFTATAWIRLGPGT